MMSSSRNRQILVDNIEDDIRSYPMPELLRRLFPSLHVVDHGCMRSPFREDSNPSFSMYVGSHGTWMAKDFSTDRIYKDNISIYRELYPGKSYVECIQDLSLLLFGRPAIRENESVGISPVRVARKESMPARKAVSRPSVLHIRSVVTIDSPEVPESTRDWWRMRCISDNNMLSSCFYATLVNTNKAGTIVRDSQTGLPILDGEGKEMKHDGLISGVGMYNDIGGFVIRAEDTFGHKGFKGSTSSFITTILADGSRPESVSRLCGKGNDVVSECRFDPVLRRLFINRDQWFDNISLESADLSFKFVEQFFGHSEHCLGEREKKALSAVLTNINSSVSGTCIVVEGMFEALTFQELRRRSDTDFRPGVDVVILNSISNMKWAVPFLCKEREVRLLLNNDLQSSAGQKATEKLLEEINSFRTGTASKVVAVSQSEILKSYNDLNDAYMAECGKLEAYKDFVAGRKEIHSLKIK